MNPTTYQPWYFVIWTQDDASNWSAISSTVSAYPPASIPGYGLGSIDVTSVGGGLSQGGTAWGDYDSDGDLDVVVSGTDGTNNQVRVYKSNGDGTFSSTVVNVAAANAGLKDGDVAFGDYDSDGDLDVLASGSDGSNKQLRVYKNNGDATFNTTAVEVPGSANIGLSSGTVAWGDFDNDGDLDVLANGYDGSNNQLRVYKNKGDGTFDSTAINVAGLNSGLRQGGVAWGDFDKDGDLDILESGTDGTNRQLRVYKNNGDGTFNSTAIDVAGANNGLSDGRVAWGDFDKDGDLDVLVSGTDGTNFQLRTYANNGNGTFNSTPTNVAGSNDGMTFAGVAVGDFNVDGNQDILAAGRSAGLVGYWSLDENTGTAAADKTGGGRNGTLTNGATWTTGKFGSAVLFDASNDYIDIGASAILTAGSPFTIAWWEKGTANVNTYLSQFVLKMNGTSNLFITVFSNDGAYGVMAFGPSPAGSSVASTLQPSINSGLGVWRHYVITGSDPNSSTPGNYSVYVNGISYSLSSGSTFAGGTSNRIGWGVNSGTDGAMDEIRIYNRALTSGEVTALYQATKGGIGSVRIIKGVGDGTFNATPVEVDAGLEKGQVAWGDADGDGDLDILEAGTDGSSPRLNVYLSTQSLTASNTAPSAPGTLTGGISLSASGMSVASFTWTAGSDSGTGSTTENGLSYDIRISTKSDFSPLVAPGEEGASPRLGSYLKPSKIFSGNTTYGVVLKSTDPWNAHTTAPFGLRTDTTYYYQVKTVDAGLATSGWSTSGTLNTVFAPSSSTLLAVPGTSKVVLTWTAPGDDGSLGTLVGNYRIQYATYTATWSTATTPTDATTVDISTSGVSPGSMQIKDITGLTIGTTYYFVLWSQDDASNWSSMSNNPSAWAENDVVSPSTSTLSAVSGENAGDINLSWASAGDDGNAGNLTGSYFIQYATYTATWSTTTTPTNATNVSISTTNVTPGATQTKVVTGLTLGTLYYFVLWSQDESGNWSSISNTASAIPATVTLAEAVGQPGWIGQGETQRILGVAQAVSDSVAGVTVSSVAVRETGSYTADGNLTNVEVWVSSSGYIDANAVRLENTAKAFSSDAAVFTQNVTVSTTPLYFIARCDVSGSATVGTFDISLQVYTTVMTVNNPVAFSNATDVVAPPSGAPSGLSATASGSLLRVSLSWAAGTGVDSYTIYRATYSGVTTTDYFLGVTAGTSFNDDSVPPAQQMYYTVVGTNRAGASSASGAANATSVDVAALTTSNIYLRAGIPGGYVSGNYAYGEAFSLPYATTVDSAGNLYIADTGTHRIRFVPKASGTYFGQAMVANNVYTLAGTGTMGYSGNGGASTAATLWGPYGVSLDLSGNVYIADRNNCRIRFIPKTGGTYFGQAMTANYIYSIAGTGTGGYVADNVAATSAQINNPGAVSVDSVGNVYIADYSNHRIRFIAKTTGTYFGQVMTANYIYTIAGTGSGGYVADNVAATGAQIYNPSGVRVDAAGNVYIADYNNNRIRFIAKTTGTYFGQSMTANYIYTIAGNGTGGYTSDNVAATGSRLNQPGEVSVDASGNVIISDYSNSRVRFVPKTSGTYFGQSMTANYIYTLANSTYLSYPQGASVDPQGNVYIANTNYNTILFLPKASGTYFGQSMTANSVYIIVGNGSAGYSGVGRVATTARLDNGGQSSGLTVDSAGNIYIADYNNTRIFFIPKTSGTYFGQSMTANYIYTIAGNGSAGYTADNVAATSTRINNPRGVCVDSAGNVYIADTGNNRVRFIPVANGTYFGQSMTANYIYTIAGNGTGGYLADNVAATNTQIYQPSGVAVDGEGNVVFSQIYDYRVRFVPKTTGTYFGQSMTANYLYTIAGNGTAGYLADNVAATNTRINAAYGISVEVGGSVFIADSGNNRVRYVPRTTGTYFGQSMTANYIYTVAGNGTGGYVADNVAATNTQIYSPYGVNVDAGGNFSVADYNNYRVRFVPNRTGTYFGQSMTANRIYTIGGLGSGTAYYSGENAVATTKIVWKPTNVFSAPDNMVYVMDGINKVRMIAGEDFIAPSTSTLAGTVGAGQVTLNWTSAGDNATMGNLTGNYRIQYATYPASWSTSSTPINATTVTVSTTNAVAGSA